MNTPYTPASADPASPGGLALGTAGLAALAGTRLWVRVVGVVLFVLAAFTLLGAVIVTLGGAFFSTRGGSGPPPAVMSVMGLLYIAIAAVYGFMGLYLMRYGSAIARLTDARDARDLDDALVAQRKFWRLAGIVALVGVVLALLGFVAAIMIPIMAR